MAGIRTVMVTMPALLSDLIRRLACGRVELDFAGDLSGREALATQLRQLHPHLVMIGLRENETDMTVRQLLMQLPAAKFIAVSSDGRHIVGYELGGDGVTLSDLSPERLIDFIRTSAVDAGT